jgi:hypothetical protein
MVIFEAVISRFGPEAVNLLLNDKDVKADDEAIHAVKAQSDTERVDKIRHWLQIYEVFQYIPGPQRSAIAAAVLCWADSRDISIRLTTEDALCKAHESLMNKCVEAYGKERDFKSLASKALWLCYPNDVPIFDSFAQRALWVFAKIDNDITPLSDNALIDLAPQLKNREYRQFVHIWKALYDLNKQSIDALEKHDYPYSVRVFDKILWIIGSPYYRYDSK